MKTVRLLLLCSLLATSLAHAQDISPPLTGVWNGFLDHQNVVECSNLGEETATLSLSLTDYNGTVLAVIPFDLPASGSKHIMLNPYGIYNSYGSYLIDNPGTPNNYKISCFTAFYRMAAAGSPKAVEYAFAMPTLKALQGMSTGVFNSFNPAVDGEPVLNYLSIYNPGTSALSAKVEIYGQDGTLDTDKSFTITPLQPSERKDFALGHEDGQVVGLYRIVPDDDSLPYGAFITRYARNGLGGYQFAFPLLALEPNCSPGPIPASTMDPAINWGEVANPTSKAVDAHIQILDRNGAVLLDEERSIPPFSQHHTHINSYLGEKNVGTFLVKCAEGQNEGGLLVQSLYYGRFNDLTPEIEWAYASQAMGNLTSNNTAIAAHANTFLGAANWFKLLDSGSTGAQISLDSYNETGSLSSHQDYSIPLGGSVDAGIHESVGGDFIGLSVASLLQNAQIYPELLRVFPHQHTSVGYIMSVPSDIFPAPLKSDRQKVLDDYNANYLGSSVSYSELGWTGSTSGCQAGDISSQARAKVLQRINYFRRAAGLPDDVIFDATKNAKCQQAALMMSANHSLSHSPPTNWKCYTADGAQAAGKSNLALGYHSTSAISAYINDFGSGNTAVGHRRWILYSRAKVMGDGSTSNAQALWVIGDFGATPTNLPAFISWPPPGYVPSPLIYGRWSFSIPGASFSGTTVEMTDEQNNALSLTILPIRSGYADNTIVWEPQGVVRNNDSDTTYKVTLNNVVVNGETKSYTYDVIIIQPTQQSSELVDNLLAPELGEAPLP